MSNLLFESMVSSFHEQVKKQSDVHIQEESGTYREKLIEIQKRNASLLKETTSDYSKKQEDLAKRMKQMIDKKSTESDNRLKAEVNGINNDLLCDN